MGNAGHSPNCRYSTPWDSSKYKILHSCQTDYHESSASLALPLVVLQFDGSSDKPQDIIRNFIALRNQTG